MAIQSVKPGRYRFLFGDSESAPVLALSSTTDEDSSLPLNRNRAALLISSVGQFSFAEDSNELRSGPGNEGVAVIFERKIFSDMMNPFRPGLQDSLRNLLQADGPRFLFEPLLPPDIKKRILGELMDPPLNGPALPFYYEAKIKELIAFGCFGKEQGTGDFFCTRQKKLTMDRMTETMQYLREHLDEPLDLQIVADKVGCSASYLSRTFSNETGMTLSQYFRKLRIERAAELLVTGRYNVSEVAVEVGYNSLSHFSKAFQQEKGCLPSRFEVA